MLVVRVLRLRWLWKVLVRALLLFYLALVVGVVEVVGGCAAAILAQKSCKLEKNGHKLDGKVMSIKGFNEYSGAEKM